MTTPPPYNPQIPQPKNTIAQGQIDFLNNFMQLFNAFSVDHIPLNAAADAGNHAVARLVEQSVDPSTQVSEMAFYSKKVAEQTDQLYLRTQGNAPEIQYSNYQIYPLQNILNPNGTLYQFQVFSFLPGNIIVYFGQIFPISSPAILYLNPPICKNISSVDLGVLNTPGVYKSVVAPISDPQGYITGLQLTSSHLVVSQLPAQSYIVFGNPS